MNIPGTNIIGVQAHSLGNTDVEASVRDAMGNTLNYDLFNSNLKDFRFSKGLPYQDSVATVQELKTFFDKINNDYLGSNYTSELDDKKLTIYKTEQSAQQFVVNIDINPLDGLGKGQQFVLMHVLMHIFTVYISKIVNFYKTDNDQSDDTSQSNKIQNIEQEFTEQLTTFKNNIKVIQNTVIIVQQDNNNTTEITQIISKHINDINQLMNTIQKVYGTSNSTPTLAAVNNNQLLKISGTKNTSNEDVSECTVPMISFEANNIVAYDYFFMMVAMQMIYYSLQSDMELDNMKQNNYASDVCRAVTWIIDKWNKI